MSVQLRLVRPDEPETVLHTPLSQREHDCLLWAARGKIYEEISMILGVKFATVKHHLDRARHRLGADNLQHATALPVCRGILRPDEVDDYHHPPRR